MDARIERGLADATAPFSYRGDRDFVIRLIPLSAMDDDPKRIEGIYEKYAPIHWLTLQWGLIYCLRWRLFRCAKALKWRGARIDWCEEFNGFALSKSEMLVLLDYGAHPNAYYCAWGARFFVNRRRCRPSMYALIAVLKKHSPLRRYVAKGVDDQIIDMVWQMRGSDEWDWGPPHGRNHKNMKLPE